MNRLAVNVIVAFCLFLFLLLMLWGIWPSKPTQNAEAPPKQAKQAASVVHNIHVQGEAITVPAPAGSALEYTLPPGDDEENEHEGVDEKEENRILIRFSWTHRGKFVVFLLSELNDAPDPMTAAEFGVWKREWNDEADRRGKLTEDIPQPPPEYADRIAFLEGGETLPVGDDDEFLTTETSVKGGKYSGTMFVTRMLVKDIPLAVTVLSLTETGEADDALPLIVAWREAILKAN